MTDQSRTAAFFDLDRTLIDANSAVLYARYERRLGRISSWQLFITCYYTLLYHLNIGSMEKAYGKALQYYAGTVESDLIKRTQDFFNQEILSRLQPGALDSLNEHRRRGHLLVMLTTSSSYQAACASTAWGFDHWIANRFHTAQGRLLGTYNSPLCYADGKRVYAESWAQENRVDLAKSYFYTDSYSDLPMLQAVGFPMVVNPDPKLKAYALREEWDVLDWRFAKKTLTEVVSAG